MTPWIKWTKYGLASTIGNTIYINKKLLKFPGLYQKVLSHEMKHVQGADFTLDFKEPFDLELLVWVIKHPSSWVHYLPVWYFQGKIVWARTMLMLWLLAFGIVMLCIGFAKWIS